MISDVRFGGPEDQAGAILSEDGRYRYRLWRRWDDVVGPIMTFVMLNPSTADHMKNDRTTEKCMHIARREGCSGIELVNLFAYRATEPDDLLTVGPVEARGPNNSKYLAEVVRTVPGPLVAAWGAWWDRQACRRSGPGFSRLWVEGLAAQAGRGMFCLGRTQSGAPKHPCRLANDTPLEPFA